MIGDGTNRIAHVLKHSLTELNETLGGRCHPNLTPYSKEEGLTQFIFEESNLSTDRRLRHVEFATARRERARLRDRLENFQLAQIHWKPRIAELSDCGKDRYRR